MDFGLSMKQLLGKRAEHVPMHGIIQRGYADGVVLCVFASKLPPVNPLEFGASETHLFVHGDMIVRPHTVFASNHCRDMGIEGLITSSSFCDLDEWKEHGRQILAPL